MSPSLVAVMQDLYTPEVTLEDVALPEEHRHLITSTFLSFKHFQKVSKIT